MTNILIMTETPQLQELDAPGVFNVIVKNSRSLKSEERVLELVHAM